MWCQNKIYEFESGDSFTQEVKLEAFQSFYFKENYDEGEPGTTVELKARNRPLMVMIINQRDDVDNKYFIEENNNAESQTTILRSWYTDGERKQFDQEKNNMFLQITNLALLPVDLKVTISSSSF